MGACVLQKERGKRYVLYSNVLKRKFYKNYFERKQLGTIDTVFLHITVHSFDGISKQFGKKFQEIRH